MSSPAQMICQGVRFAYGPSVILDDVSVSLTPGDRIGIVGPNGSGKSTLLRLLAGQLRPEAGTIKTVPRHASVVLLNQTLIDAPGDTVASYLARSTGIAAIADEFELALESVSRGAPESADRYDQALSTWLGADVATFEQRRTRILRELGLGEVEVDHRTIALSGGQRARLGLATLALSTADIILLDEPTNDLDSQGLDLLERLVTELDQPAAIVSHDRAFLATVANAIVEIDDHSKTTRRFNGGFGAWQEERQRAADRHRRDYDEYQAKRATLADRANRERRWSNQGVSKARRSGEGDKFVRNAAIASAQDRLGAAKRTQRALERLDRDHAVETPWKRWELRLEFGAAERSGQYVAALFGAVIERGDPAGSGIRLGPVDLVVEASDRILISGANGSGKTTLVSALLGQLPLASGTQRVGPSVKVGVLDQRRTAFDETDSLGDAFASASGLGHAEARSQLAKLGLDTGKLDRAVSELSPGERTRAVLGVFAATGTNLLVCDEPTNHLDLEAIEALESALEVYRHTLLLITHDRRMIESVETSRHWHVDEGRVSER